MMRISSMASSAMGLVSGAVSMAVPLALEMSPLNPLAAGATVAVSVGIASYGLWHNYGKNYLAEYIANAVDNALKDQKDAIEQAVNESVKSKLPTIIGSSPIVDSAIKSAVNVSIDNYSTDRQTVRKVLDDLDNHVPYETNATLSEFVNQATESILEAKCSGIYKPLQPYLKRPLSRIVATVAANCLKKTTEVAVEAAKQSSVGHVVTSAEVLAQTDLVELISWTWA